MVIPNDNQIHQDVNEIMDRAKLTPGYIQGAKIPTAIIISRVRMSLTTELIAYIKRLEAGPKRIEVREDRDSPMK